MSNRRWDGQAGTGVEVTWKSVALPLEELTRYRVVFRETVQGQKREAKCTCEEFEVFPRDTNSGVIGGLETGESYQFQVTALARTLDMEQRWRERGPLQQFCR